MKKTLKILSIILSLILLRLLISFTVNEIIKINYNNNIYNSHLVKTLYLFNFNQPYIAYYNEGNILYKTEKYDDASKKYRKSLEKNPPQSKVCDIRINLSLTLIKQIDSSNYKTVYNKLEEAKNNLYINNCASETDDSGYSNDAEKLEEEIKKLQSELNSSPSSNPSNDKDKEPEDKKDYSDIEEKLKEIEKDSNASRQSDMDIYENMGDYSYYSKKRW